MEINLRLFLGISGIFFIFFKYSADTLGFYLLCRRRHRHHLLYPDIPTSQQTQQPNPFLHLLEYALECGGVPELTPLALLYLAVAGIILFYNSLKAGFQLVPCLSKENISQICCFLSTCDSCKLFIITVALCD